MRQRRTRALGAALFISGQVFPARAVSPTAAHEEVPSAVELAATPGASGDAYWHWLATVAVGAGLRFNNPYRLSTQIGHSTSLSLSAPYLDVGMGGLTGAPNGLQHGALVRISLALQGVPQEVITPNYLGLYRFAGGRMVYMRGGLPVVTRPDLNLGAEVAGGGVLLVQAGWGLTAELGFSHYLGAATRERAATAIDLVSFQAGLLWDYEDLP